MRSYGRTKQTVGEMIRSILPQIIEQPVQIQYSGEGKKMKNVEAEKSFNATCTFKCLSGKNVSHCPIIISIKSFYLF